MAEKDAVTERARRDAEVGETSAEKSPERVGNATASDEHRNGADVNRRS